MKFTALFIIALTATCALGFKASSKATMQLGSAMKVLESTGWGQVAIAFVELQTELGGPLDELGQAFKSLLSDLNFKISTEARDYAEQLAEHKEIEREINGRIKAANMDIGIATHKLDNWLYPHKAELEQAIINDNALIVTTKANMEIATAERAAEQAWYEEQIIEHNLALEALDDCLVLLNDLKNPSPTLVQVTKARNSVKKTMRMLKSLNSKYAPLMQALIKLAQNFADQGILDKIMNKMVEVQENLRDSLITMANDNDAQLSTFNTYMAVCANTILEAEHRIVINTEDLLNTDNTIAETEQFRTNREADLATAHLDFETETGRWDKITTIHLDLMAQLNDELGAVNDCIDVFTSFSASPELMGSMNK